MPLLSLPFFALFFSPALLCLGIGSTYTAGTGANETTVALFGTAVAGGLDVAVHDDTTASGGKYASPKNAYAVVARSRLPGKGDPLHVWIRYRGLALQMKTDIGGRTVEFPWNWDRHADGFAWRNAGVFQRSELGESVWFMADTKFSGASGVDALVVTSDPAWVPAQAAAAVGAANMPDAANATVAFTGSAPDEASTPGEATVRIDWKKTGARVEPFIYSLNVFRINEPGPLGTPAWHQGIRYMAPRLLRFHNGGLANSWFDPSTGKWNYAKIRSILREARPPAGTVLMLNINGWPDAYDTDKDQRLDPDRVDDYALLCADLVRFLNIELKAGFLYWEVTNERDMPYWRKPASGREPDVAALADIYNQAAAAMRAIDPAIKIGGPAACYPLPAQPLQEFVRLTRGQLDFISYHNYASGAADESDQTIYEKTDIIAANAADLVRWLKDIAPDRVIEVHLNEYNVSYTWLTNEVRMINHKGAVYDALSMISLARVPGLTALNAWNDMDRAYGKMDNAGVFRPAAHVYHYFNTYLHGTMASAVSSADKAVVPFAIADGNQGRPAFALVNRTNAVQSVTVRFDSPPAGSWTTASTDGTGLHAPAPVSFGPTVTLPPHSVHFFWLD